MSGEELFENLPEMAAPKVAAEVGAPRLRQPERGQIELRACDLDSLLARLARSGFQLSGPVPGSRRRPDGLLLKWRTAQLGEPGIPLAPFFIEWSADSVHPSKDTSAHCELDYFEILSADPEELSSTLKRIGLDLPVQRSDKARLHALISGPKGDAKLST